MLEGEEYSEPHILERGRSYARRGAEKYISRHEDTIEANMIVQEWLPHNAAAVSFLRFWISYMRYKLTKYRR